jgi:hypothetical protein
VSGRPEIGFFSYSCARPTHSLLTVTCALAATVAAAYPRHCLERRLLCRASHLTSSRPGRLPGMPPPQLDPDATSSADAARPPPLPNSASPTAQQQQGHRSALSLHVQLHYEFELGIEEKMSLICWTKFELGYEKIG